MNEEVLELKAIVENCVSAQMYFTSFWHENEPLKPEYSSEPTLENLRNIILSQHFYNFSLWHIEDMARRTDVDDSLIADCKRKIDRFNQQRNDCIEEVDKHLYSILAPLLPKNITSRQNTETVGMVLDRLSILALKVFHMEEQTKRNDVNNAHRALCMEKLSVLNRQRRDLLRALLELISDYVEGRKVPVLYSQFKMYNDPALNPELYGRSLKGGEA